MHSLVCPVQNTAIQRCTRTGCTARKLASQAQRCMPSRTAPLQVHILPRHTPRGFNSRQCTHPKAALPKVKLHGCCIITVHHLQPSPQGCASKLSSQSWKCPSFCEAASAERAPTAAARPTAAIPKAAASFKLHIPGGTPESTTSHGCNPRVSMYLSLSA